jgi:hypothetical protein
VRRDVKASASRFQHGDALHRSARRPRKTAPTVAEPLSGSPEKWPESPRALRCADVLLETHKALFRRGKEYIATEFRASML